MRPWPGHAYPSAPPTTAPAPTSRCSPRSRSKVELCLFDARGQGDPGPAHRGRRLRLARLPARASSPASATATGCTARTTRRTGQRCNPTKLLIDPYAKAVDGPVALGRGRVRLPVRRRRTAATTPTRRRTCRSRWWSTRSSTGAPTAPPRIPYHETVIYEAHVRGLTIAHPEIPRGAARHLHRPRAPGDDRAPASGSGVTAVELMPVHEFLNDHHLQEKGLSNYWGYNTIALPGPAPRLRAAAGSRPGQPGAGVQGDGPRPARRGHRGDPRRGLQPHRRGQPHGPDAVHARHRQRRLLPRWSRTTRGTTWTTPAPATRSTCATRTPCS